MKPGAVVEGLDVIEDGGADVGAGGSPARPLLWPRCVHWHAITPALPSCTPRCISHGCEPAYLTVSSCGLPLRF